jgi:hypothetical protein
MARKARWLGLLAIYRELSPHEREVVDRALDDDPEAREIAHRFAEQDRLLASLTPPSPSPALRERVIEATIARRDAAPGARWRPVVAVALSLLLLVLVGGTGMASSASLPGDSLYPIKRAGEQVRLALTIRDQARIRYAQRLSEMRRQEVTALLSLGRAEIGVVFEGPLEQSEGKWLVAGVPIILAEQAGDPSQMVAGSCVRVTGEIAQNQVRVQSLHPLPSSSAAPGDEPAHHPQRQRDEPPTRNPMPVPPSPTPTTAPPEPPATEAPASPNDDAARSVATPTPTVAAEPGRPQEPGPPAGRPENPSPSTPPGHDKRARTPADPDPERGPRQKTPEERTRGGPPAAVAPTAASRGAVNRDEDGHPQPTRRPPHAGPPERRGDGDNDAARDDHDDRDERHDRGDRGNGANRGSVNRDESGHPQPTRRPPHARPPDANQKP